VIHSELHFYFYTVFTPLNGEWLDTPEDVMNRDKFICRKSYYVTKSDDVLAKMAPEEVVFSWEDKTFYTYEPPELVDPVPANKPTLEFLRAIVGGCEVKE
jgi:hypothetical protein